MSIERDFKAYHESIADELSATRNRIRHLIGCTHWQTDGEHKEAVLRKVLRNHVAEALHIGKGFVCGPFETSHQIDIMITGRDKPTLFRDGELVLATPDAIACIIEVKTQVQSGLDEILKKLAADVEMIRKNGSPDCKAGLFIYDASQHANNHKRVLQHLQDAAGGDENRVLNWLAAGPDIFMRYWSNADTDVNGLVNGPAWHSYHLKNLAHAYFLSNVVWDTCHHPDDSMQYAWFPVEGGKEGRRQWYAPLAQGSPMQFPGACTQEEGTSDGEEE